MPLVHMAGGAEPASSERQRQARKIKPQYSEGKLVKVAGAQNRRRGGDDPGAADRGGNPQHAAPGGGRRCPDFLVAGRRDILVPESGAEAAREALAWEQPAALDEDRLADGCRA